MLISENASDKKTPKRKRKWAVKNLTERDKLILKDLYDYRILTIQQLRGLYFDSESYCYLRLEMLRNSGYIQAKPIVKNGRKVEGSFMISDKGIRALETAGMIEEASLDANKRPRLAKDNRPQNGKIPYFLERNLLHTELSPYGWTFIESRRFKSLYNINRGAIVKGGLVSKSGEEYAVYIVDTHAREATHHKIIMELNEYKFRRTLILVKDNVKYEELRTLIIKESLGVEEVIILPFKEAIEIFKVFPSEKHFLFFVGHYGKVELFPNKYLFGNYLMHNSGREWLIVNRLFGDIRSTHFLKKYNKDAFLRENKSVFILAWKNEEDELRKEFKDFNHVAIQSFDFPFIKRVMQKAFHIQ